MRANERPILPQAVCPALSCRGVGSGEGSLWFCVTLTRPATLSSAGLQCVLLVLGLRSLSAWWHHIILSLIIWLTFLILISGLTWIVSLLLYWIGSYFIYVIMRSQCLCWPSLHSERKQPASPSALISWLLSLIFTSLKAFGKWCASWQEQIAAERRSALSLLCFLLPESFSLTSVTPARLHQTSHSKSSGKVADI